MVWTVTGKSMASRGYQVPHKSRYDKLDQLSELVKKKNPRNLEQNLGIQNHKYKSQGTWIRANLEETLLGHCNQQSL